MTSDKHGKKTLLTSQLSSGDGSFRLSVFEGFVGSLTVTSAPTATKTGLQKPRIATVDDVRAGQTDLRVILPPGRL